MGSALAHAAAGAGARVTIASRDARKARRLAAVYGGEGVDLAAGAELAETSAGVAVALAGVWEDLARPRTLPPIADISAPSAVPATVRAGLNGSFLGIDDLFRGGQPPPRGYVEAAESVVAAKTVEYVRWLESRR
jgi:glutamyl-tRNA reductase